MNKSFESVKKLRRGSMMPIFRSGTKDLTGQLAAFKTGAYTDDDKAK
jgi:hypothetical protein